MRLHIQPTATQRLSAQDLCRLVLATLEDMKAEEIVTIDLAGKTEIADYMVIASGTSGRQLAAIAERLAERLKAQALGPVPMEGLEAGEWIVLDLIDVIVHLFRPEIRTHYNLEKMWSAVLPRGREEAFYGVAGEARS